MSSTITPEQVATLTYLTGEVPSIGTSEAGVPTIEAGGVSRRVFGNDYEVAANYLIEEVETYLISVGVVQDHANELQEQEQARAEELLAASRTPGDWADVHWQEALENSDEFGDLVISAYTILLEAANAIRALDEDVDAHQHDLILWFDSEVLERLAEDEEALTLSQMVMLDALGKMIEEYVEEANN